MHLVYSGLIQQQRGVNMKDSDKEHFIPSYMSHSNKKANRLHLTVTQLIEQQNQGL